MKVWRNRLVWVLLAVAATSVLGCSRNKQDPTLKVGSSPTSDVKQAADGPLKPGETGELNGVRFTLTRVEADPQEEQRPAAEAGQPEGDEHAFLLAQLQIANDSQKTVDIRSVGAFSVTGPDGTPYFFSVNGYGRREGRLDGTLAPGEGRTGWTGFSVAPGAGDWTLEIRLPGETEKLRFVFPLPKLEDPSAA